MIELTYLIGKERDPRVLERLEAFDFYLKMEPYRIVCACLGQEAIKRAESSPEARDLCSILDCLEQESRHIAPEIQSLAPELPSTYSLVSDPQAEGTISELARRYPDFPREELLDLAYKTKVLNRRLRLIIRSRAAGDPLYQKSDPDCEECFGKGWLMTSTNPQGYWRSWDMNGALYLAREEVIDNRAIDCRLCRETRATCNRCWGLGHWLPSDQIDPERHCCQAKELLALLEAGRAPVPSVVIDHDLNYISRRGQRFGKHPALAEREWVAKIASLLRCNNCWIWPIDCHL